MRIKKGPIPAAMARRDFVKTVAMGAAASSALLGGATSLGAQAHAATPPRVGINLAGMADWNTELPFVDVFRMSRPWTSQAEGQPYGQGPALELDKWGWVKRLAPGAWAETFLCGVARTPPGEWTVLYKGVGTIELWGNGVEMLSSGPGTLTFDVAPGSSGGFVLRVLDTDPTNYVRNIRVVMPGMRSATSVWNPSFLARWQGMAALRFMDFMETNNSKVVHFADRPSPSHATFVGRGVPISWLVDLANRLHVDPWFNVPHLADDAYVQGIATYVRDHLKPELRAHVEYSNEVWNSMFDQHRYAEQRGLELGLASDGFTAGLHFYAQRATEVFRIWENTFGNPARIVRVLAAQAANSYTGSEILKAAGGEADALAIAPYVSFNVTPDQAGAVDGWSEDQLFARLDSSLAESTSWIQANKQVTGEYGVKLMAYEGGQHLTGVFGAENDDQLTKLLTTANADPRMGALYARYHQTWAAAGGDLFCHFSSVCGWSKWGSWGLLQQYDDDPAAAPKFKEVMRWAKSVGQGVSVPG
jgi:hypothetical protein